MRVSHHYGKRLGVCWRVWSSLEGHWSASAAAEKTFDTFLHLANKLLHHKILTYRSTGISTGKKCEHILKMGMKHAFIGLLY